MGDHIWTVFFVTCYVTDTIARVIVSIEKTLAITRQTGTPFITLGSFLKNLFVDLESLHVFLEGLLFLAPKHLAPRFRLIGQGCITDERIRWLNRELSDVLPTRASGFSTGRPLCTRCVINLIIYYHIYNREENDVKGNRNPLENIIFQLVTMSDRKVESSGFPCPM